MLILLVCAALLGSAAAAQEGPRVTVTLDPEGPVTVGTPVEVTATLLVPSFLPKPPDWPDLQIADALTRPPETWPTTARVGQESWSGLTRSWQIVPQRAADYDLGQPEITVTYADPATSRPVETTLALPEIAFSARLPAGAEGMDPFLPATALTLAAQVDGLPDAPKPGDAFTLTLTLTAEGPPAILLPPLLAGLATPPGLNAYPKAPRVSERPGERGGPPRATRVEAVTYVIEKPGGYALPGVALGWWNTATGTRESAATAPVAFTVPAPPDIGGNWSIPRAALLVLAGLALGAATLFLRRRRRPRAAPSEARLYRALARAARSAPSGEIRRRLTEWEARLPAPLASPGIEAALRALERPAYGPPGAGGERAGEERAARQRLRAELETARGAGDAGRAAALPGLNPPA
ncbi:BatD family protein [Amaricoccus solimangrovi]|nr:BatD family protein [Amaricoccus solimangrovi]